MTKFLYEKDDKDVLSYVINRKDALQKAREPYIDKFSRYYRMYRSMIEEGAIKKDENGNVIGANLFIPYVYNIVETVTPRVVNTMFASRPYIGLVSVDDKFSENANVMTNLLDYQLCNVQSFITIAAYCIKSALIYGTGITKQVWKLKTRKTKSRQPMVDNGITIGYNVVEKAVIDYDDPVINYVDVFDFYIDPSAASIDEAPDCIHEYPRTMKELEGMVKNNVFPEAKLKDIKPGAENFKTGVQQRLDDVGLSSDNIDGADDKVKIWEYWTDDEFVMIANETVVLVNEENPYWHHRKPFARVVDIPVPGEFYGIGEIEPVEYLQRELNTTRKQRMDNINIIINKMYKILRSANIDPDQLVSRPGGFVEVDNPDDLTEITFTDVTQSAYNEEQVIKADMDKTDGVYDYTRGAPSNRRETATTATIMSDSSNERFKLKILLMEQMWLVPLGKQLASLNQQYYDKDKLISLVRDNEIFSVSVTPDLLSGEFEFMALGSAVDPVYNKQLRQQNLLQMFGVMNGLNFVDLPKLTLSLLKAFDIKNAQEIVKLNQNVPIEVVTQLVSAITGQPVRPEQVTMMLQQITAAMQSQGMNGGGSGGQGPTGGVPTATQGTPGMEGSNPAGAGAEANGNSM
jgi:hypothetical protein